MIKAVYAGSFDPVTNGHMDVIKRAAGIVDELVVGVAVNSKKNPMFSVDERVDMLKEAVKDIPNVGVEAFEGFTVTCARNLGAQVMIRGIRGNDDFDKELQLARINKHMDSDIETVFLLTSPECSFISSSFVKEVVYIGADVSDLVPEGVAEKLKERIV